MSARSIDKGFALPIPTSVNLTRQEKNNNVMLLLDQTYFNSLQDLVNFNEKESDDPFKSFADLHFIYYYIHLPTHDDDSKNRTKGTKKEYLRDLLQFYTFLQFAIEEEYLLEQHKVPESILKAACKRHIRSYQTWLKNLTRVDGKVGYPSSTRSRKVSVVKSFLGWLYDHDIIEEPLPIAFRKSTNTIHERPDRALSLKEVQDLLGYYKHHPINHALLMTLFTTGLRVNEIATARWSDVYYDSDVNEGSYFLRVVGKGNKVRHARIMKATMDSIVVMRKLRRLNTEIDPSDDSPLFCTNKQKPYSYKYLSNYVIDMIKRTEFDWLRHKKGNISSHWARHFFVTYSIIQRGIPIEIVQQTVGHSNKSVTAGYVSKHLDKQKDASWGWDEKEFSKI